MDLFYRVDDKDRKSETKASPVYQPCWTECEELTTHSHRHQQEAHTPSDCGSQHRGVHLLNWTSTLLYSSHMLFFSSTCPASKSGRYRILQWRTHCCGRAPHSSTSICRKSASVVVLVNLARTACPNWSHECSMGLRSGLLAGHSILSTPKFWRYSLRNPALRVTRLVTTMRRRYQAVPNACSLQMWHHFLLHF